MLSCGLIPDGEFVSLSAAGNSALVACYNIVCT
jgi:hypothetical protein